jgi:hypothetical protein
MPRDTNLNYARHARHHRAATSPFADKLIDRRFAPAAK